MVTIQERKIRILISNIYMKVIYYYSFLFYTKFVKDDTPHSTTIWAIGIAEGFFASAIFNLLIIHFFCYNTGKWPMIGITLIFLLMNYIYFSKSNRSKIIKEKPVFFGSHKISILLTAVFYIILLSSLFLGPIYGKYLLNNC